MIKGSAITAVLAGCLGVLSGSAGGQPFVWSGMVIDHAAASAGVVPGYFVIRDASASAADGVELRDSIANLPGIAATRPVAEGVRLGGARYHVVRVDPSLRVDELHAAVGAHDGFEVFPVIAGQATFSPTDLPNDPFLVNQYAIQNNGQSVGGVPGTAGADVRIAEAWELQRGSAQVRVAVLDSGVSATHPDLISKLDDGINVTGGLPSDTDAPLNSHGTHIAGIVAASTNNAEGVVGVSWGSRIVPIKAANPIGFTSDVWLAEGLIWAAENEVDIAILSFGLSAPSVVLADAVRHAVDRGVIVFASAGNTGQEGVLYPAAYPEVIAVGATDNTDNLASFSSTGPQIEFVAPGVDIYSTMHTVFAPHTYGFSSGTSVSTPIVAGVAALLRSASPDAGVEEIRTVLARTARDLGALGRDPRFGYGRINAQRALQEILGEPWCYADVDGDGTIQPSDYSVWVAIYAMGDPRADQNRDGAVTPADFNAFVVNYQAQRGACWSD